MSGYTAIYITATPGETIWNFADRMVAIKKLIPYQRVWGTFNGVQIEAAKDTVPQDIINKYNRPQEKK